MLADHNVRHSRKRLSGHRHNRRNNRRQPSLSNLHRWHRAIRSKNRGKNSRKATGRSFAQARTQCSWCSDGSKISVYNGLSPKIPYNPTRTDEGFSACCPCGDGRLCNHLWGPRLYRVSLDRSISASRGSREVPAASRMDFCSAPRHNDFRRHRYHRFSSRSPVVHLRMFSLSTTKSSIAAS